MYATFVKYPKRPEWAHGGSGEGLESLAVRLAMHADMYGSDPTVSGFIFSADTRTVIATFDGGFGPNGRPLSFCADCLKTYEIEKDHTTATYRCLERAVTKKKCSYCNDTGTICQMNDHTGHETCEPCPCQLPERERRRAFRRMTTEPVRPD